MSSRLSLGYLTLPAASAAEIIEAAAAALVPRVGLRVAGRRPADRGSWPVRDRQQQHELATLLADTGIKVASVTAYTIAPDITTADFLPVFEAATRLGARCVCTSGYDPDLARFADSFAALAEAASRFHLTLALEFVPYSEVRTLAAANKILDRAPSRHAGIVLDMMHFMRSGGAVSELAGIAPARFAFVQICDGPETSPAPRKLADEARTSRLLPGEGAFPIRAILDALAPDIDVEIETPHAGLAHLPPREQAIICANAVRMFLAQPRDER